MDRGFREVQEGVPAPGSRQVKIQYGAPSAGPQLLGITGVLKLHTKKAPEFIDITEQVQEFVDGVGVKFGIVNVFSKHTTAAVVINEREAMLMRDLNSFLERMAPRGVNYWHNDFEIRTENMTPDEKPNAHAHCQHLLLGASQVIPIAAGKLALGTWQRIFFVELDCPRDRQIDFQLFGMGG